MTRGPDKRFDRQEVLGKAMELFWENGYEATGMSQLVEHMGIGRQSLYNTFGDKRSLYLEALAAYSQAVVEPVLQVLEAPGSPLASLRRVFDHWENLISDKDFAGCLAGNTMAEMAHLDAEVATLLQGYMGHMRSALQAALERGQEAGEITSDLPAADLARTLVTVAEGAALLAKTTKDRVAARAVMNTSLALMEAKIAHREPVEI